MLVSTNRTVLGHSSPTPQLTGSVVDVRHALNVLEELGPQFELQIIQNVICLA